MAGNLLFGRRRRPPARIHELPVRIAVAEAEQVVVPALTNEPGALQIEEQVARGRLWQPAQAPAGSDGQDCEYRFGCRPLFELDLRLLREPAVSLRGAAARRERHRQGQRRCRGESGDALRH